MIALEWTWIHALTHLYILPKLEFHYIYEWGHSLVYVIKLSHNILNFSFFLILNIEVYTSNDCDNRYQTSKSTLLHSFTCVIPTDFQYVGVPNLLHMECRMFLEKRTHFRHSNYLIYNKYDASERVKVTSMHCTKNAQVLQISCYDTSPYPLRKRDYKWRKLRWVFNRKTMSYGS